jgi:hypothetical protein
VKNTHPYAVIFAKTRHLIYWKQAQAILHQFRVTLKNFPLRMMDKKWFSISRILFTDNSVPKLVQFEANFQLHFPKTRLFSLCKGQVNKRVTGNPEVFSLQIRSPEKVWWDRTLWTQANPNRVIRGMSLNPEGRLRPLSQETLILHTQHPKLPRKHHISKKKEWHKHTWVFIHSLCVNSFTVSQCFVLHISLEMLRTENRNTQKNP